VTVSAEAEVTNAQTRVGSLESYDRLIKTIHWVTLLLIGGAYLAMWGSEFVASKEQRSALTTLHYSLGITVLLLTVFRLGWRWHARIPSLPADLPAVQRAAARATECLLYALLVVQPMLGLLHLNSRGRTIYFYFLGELPPLIASNKMLADRALAAHDVIAYLLLAVIALHAAAALFHHFIRRDNVLNAMLPRRRA
jgi:cytochrome b561